MKKIITPKSWGHNSVPLKQFQGYTIILESGDTIVYPHTNQYPTLQQLCLGNQKEIFEQLAILEFSQ